MLILFLFCRFANNHVINHLILPFSPLKIATGLHFLWNESKQRIEKKPKVSKVTLERNQRNFIFYAASSKANSDNKHASNQRAQAN